MRFIFNRYKNIELMDKIERFRLYSFQYDTKVISEIFYLQESFNNKPSCSKRSEYVFIAFGGGNKIYPYKSLEQ